MIGTYAMLLAEQQPKGPEFGKASPLGLLVILLLLVGTVLLIRSMNSKLRKLPTTFDADHPEADQEFDEGTDPGAAADDAGASGRADGRASADGGGPPAGGDVSSGDVSSGESTVDEQRPTGA
ncbi:hypothetical protein GCM10009624_20920 [Gordonia sinesedis]